MSPPVHSAGDAGPDETPSIHPSGDCLVDVERLAAPPADPSERRHLKLLLVAASHHRASADVRSLVAFLER
ncbi:MAG: ATPase, partial [Vulcanococcus sp.]